MQNIASSTVNFWRFTLGQNGAGDLFDSEALFAQAQKAPVNLMAGPQSTVSAPSFLLSLATFAGVYLICYLVFIRRIEHEDLGSRGSVWQLVLMTLVGTLVISFDIANKLLTVTDASFGLQLSYRLMHGLMCGFLLWVEYRLLYAQRIADEKAAAEALLDAGARQYELARETVAAIDRRCHDLRHLVLRQLSEGGTGADGSVRIDRSQLARVAREIDVYDMRAKTGNEALDVILTEKALLARQRGVSLECMVDGSALAAVSPADLYALVGCLVDSSVDAAAESDDSTVLQPTSGRAVLACRQHTRQYRTVLHDARSSALRRDTPGRHANHRPRPGSHPLVAITFFSPLQKLRQHKAEVGADARCYRHAEGEDHGRRVFLVSVNRSALTLGIDDPVLAHARIAIEGVLRRIVHVAARRAHHHGNQVRCALAAALGELVLVAHDQHVGLNEGRVVGSQVHGERRDVRLAGQTIGFDIVAHESTDLKDQPLVLSAGSGQVVQLPLYQLRTLPFRQSPIVLCRISALLTVHSRSIP